MFSEGNGFGTPDSTSLTSVTSVRTGYAVGGGFEYLLAPSWSVKAEYLYLGGFGTLATAPAPVVFINPAPFSSVFNHSVTFTANVVRIGLNYRFK
jgi:outer membrane immunogenic protein